MLPYLVHIHLYHTEFWPELRDALSVLEGTPYDLYITFNASADGLKERLEREVPNARLLPVSNRGYDVYPFLCVLKEVELSRYSYCIKLHTKRNMPLEAAPWNGARWRNLLLAFMRPSHFSRCVREMGKNRKIGMTGHQELILDWEPTSYDFRSRVGNLLNRTGLSLKEYRFIAGTMFLCRAHLLEPLKKLGFREDDFMVPDRKVDDERSLPHVLERYLGCLVIAQGYTVEDCFTTQPTRRVSKIECCARTCAYQLVRFLYQNKITKRGDHIIKVCKIPVFVRRRKKDTTAEE